jgi:hypothetical protein
MTAKRFARAVALETLSWFSLMITCISASPFQAARRAVTATDLQQFAGTWTALHNGTRILVLELHNEKGELAGDIRVCSFTINTEDTGKIVEITDPALSKRSPVRNLVVSGKSLSFDWNDPDGDENHWKLELIGTDAGRLNWVGLPHGLKVEPIQVTRKAPTTS